MSLSSSEYSPLHLGVANEVRAWLARRRISASAAAKALGWKQPYISRRLTGHQPFDAADLIVLGELLNVSPGEFFHAPAESPTARRARNIIYTLLRPLGVAA